MPGPDSTRSRTAEHARLQDASAQEPGRWRFLGLINFTWWVIRKDALDNNIFEGGFLGLDNIGPFDRSRALPAGVVLEQSDGTAWMAKFCLNLLEMALHLAHHDRAYEDVAVKFFEHFAYIAAAMNTGGLWDEQDGFYYDLLRLPDGRVIPLRVRSMVGLVPVFASVTLPRALWERLSDFRARVRWFVEHKPELVGAWHGVVREGQGVLTLVDERRLRRVLATMLDEEEFLSPYGLRSLSRHHREHPYVLPVAGGEARVDYEPAESTSGVFGGNSNEYFHGDTGEGLGASHQTGWTALVAALIAARSRSRPQP